MSPAHRRPHPGQRLLRQREGRPSSIRGLGQSVGAFSPPLSRGIPEHRDGSFRAGRTESGAAPPLARGGAPAAPSGPAALRACRCGRAGTASASVRPRTPPGTTNAPILRRRAPGIQICMSADWHDPASGPARLDVSDSWNGTPSAAGNLRAVIFFLLLRAFGWLGGKGYDRRALRDQVGRLS